VTKWAKLHTDEAAQLQAMWMSAALDVVACSAETKEFATRSLDAKDGRTRAAAVRVLANGVPTLPNALEVFAGKLADEHPRVRLEAVRALGRVGNARAAGEALKALEHPMDAFLDYGLWLTINELAGPWVAAVQSGEWKPEGKEKQLEFALKAIEPAMAGQVLGQLLASRPLPRDGAGPWLELIGSAGGKKEVQRLFEQLAANGFDERAAVRGLTGLNDAARLRNVIPDGKLEKLDVLFSSHDEKVRVAALQLAGTWKVAGLTSELVKAAGNADTSSGERGAAFSTLRAIGGDEVKKELQNLAEHSPAAAVRRSALTTLASLDFTRAEGLLPVALAASGEAEATELWKELLMVKDADTKLATNVSNLHLSADAARAAAKVAREGNHETLALALTTLTGEALSEKQLSPSEMQALATEALAKGDAARGERIFRRTDLACMTCHAIGGAGGKVGPDLVSIGASAQPDYLVESLLYPSAKIKEGFHSVNITTKDEEVITGIVVKENDKEVILRNAANEELSVAKANISQRANGLSLMPNGLVDRLLPEERFDLIKFLSSLGKPGQYDATRGGVARVWRLYQVTSQNEHLGMEGVTHGDFARKDWVRVYSHVNGTLPREVCAGTASAHENSRGFFAATQCQSANGGPTTFKLRGEAKAIWVNGLPAKAGPDFEATLALGTNTIVLQLDAAKVPKVVRLGSDGVTFLTD
jgi:putative heme-binding domain-containing protein